MHVSFTVRGRHQRSLILETDPRTPVGEVAEAIADAAGEPGRTYYTASGPLRGTAPITEAGLLEGAELRNRPPEPEPKTPPVLVEIRTVSGPHAGRITPLSAGTHSLGGDGHCSVVVPGAPGLAATLTVRPDGAVFVATGDDTAHLVRAASPERMDRMDRPDRPAPTTRRPADGGPSPWPYDADLAVGDVLLRWSAPRGPVAAVRPSEDGAGLDFNRPPRLVEPLPRERFRIPAPPQPAGQRPFPAVFLVAPVFLGVGMVLILHSLFFLVFAVFSPVFAIANWISDRRNNRREFRRKSAEWRTTKRRLGHEVARAVAAERLVRLSIMPDPATQLATATGPGHRLWERRRRDPDHLVLRIGTVDQASVVDVEDAARVDPLRPGAVDGGRWTVPAIPVAVSLADAGVVGIAGEPGQVRTLASMLVAQTAVAHSPRDVRLVLLTDADGAEAWEWIRWLPHARSPLGDPPVLVGNDPETVAHRVSELLATVKRRVAARGMAMGQAMFADPDIVVVLDGARRLRDVAGLVQILAEGPSVRVFALCADREMQLLPEEATTVVVADRDLLTLHRRDLPDVTGVRPDLPDAGWFEQVARALAPLRDATPEDGGSLPASVRMLDLLELPEPSAQAVTQRWLGRPASTAAVIGVGYDGPAVVDLVRDGPHTLIAGTTGSGKSELLQTLVASLAVANRPDELTFLLIDYKGGSAFHDCVRLPHTLGMVTDLDGHLVHRALESFHAELRRRERLLAEYAVKDHPEYHAARRRDPGMPPLPRLVIVVDEFATLVREVPAFISGMVSIAQRGRSLGLHLVLATQRPAGAITADIRANTNLRIALRVTDPAESQDVIDINDAAAIPPTLPGRALVRLAHRAVLPFQTGYTGAEYVTADAETPLSPTWAVAVPWNRLGRGVERPASVAVDSLGTATDLSVLVDALRAAAGELEIAEQPSPWLPALPGRITLDALPAVGTPVPEALGGLGGLPPVAYGLEDIPALQMQKPVTLDLDTLGHLYVIGAARSGRSQTLRTLAAALADRISCADVHFYGVDAGGGALTVLGELPHTGAIAHRSDIERVDRLLTRLGHELSRRQDLLAQHHSANLAELRAVLPPGPRPAHAVIFVDGWEALHTAVNDYDNGRLVDEIVRLLREGAAAGLHVIMAGDRSLLAGRIGTLNENRLLLRMTDRSDYLLVGLTMDKLPTGVTPGRGWTSSGGTETQIAVIAAAPDGAAQAEAIRALGERTRARDASVSAGSRPLTIGALPSELSFNDAFGRVKEPRPMLALLGIGGDAQDAVTTDFAGTASVFSVCGPPGTGRSTALLTIAVSLLAGGTRIVALTPRSSPLRRLAVHPHVRVLTDPNPAGEELEAALAEVGTPAVVLVDDADLLATAAARADAVLRRIVATGRDRDLGLAFAGSPEQLVQTTIGWIGEGRRLRRGLLLNPQTIAEGDLIGARIPPTQLRRPARPGRGYVADPVSGGLAQIAVPLTLVLEDGA